jgi:hypothetical protein
MKERALVKKNAMLYVNKSTFYVEIDMGIAKIMIDMTMRKK